MYCLVRVGERVGEGKGKWNGREGEVERVGRRGRGMVGGLGEGK